LLLLILVEVCRLLVCKGIGTRMNADERRFLQSVYLAPFLRFPTA
jgi:hypothetical protein